MLISKKILVPLFIFGLSIGHLSAQPSSTDSIEQEIFKLLPPENYFLKNSDKSENYEYYNWERKDKGEDCYPSTFIPPNFLNFNIEISKKDLEKSLKKKGYKFSNKWVSGNVTVIQNPSAIFSKNFIGDSVPGTKIVQYNFSDSKKNPSYVTIYIDHSKVNIIDMLKFLIQKLGQPSSYAKSIKEQDLNFYIDWTNNNSNEHVTSITLDSHDLFIRDFRVNPRSKFSYSITIYSDAHTCTENE